LNCYFRKGLEVFFKETKAIHQGRELITVRGFGRVGYSEATFSVLLGITKMQ
jgi:hypothetical protein